MKKKKKKYLEQLKSEKCIFKTNPEKISLNKCFFL